MEAIKDTLQGLMRSWEERLKKSSPDEPGVWLRKLLTKKELRHIKFRYFKKGILGLNVDSSTWLYYFNLKKEEFLNRLCQQSAGVKDISFYIGE